MNALLSAWTWFEIATVATVGFFVQAVLAVFTLPFDRRRLVVGRFLRLVAVTAAKLSPFWSFGVTGAIPTRLPERTVVVGNHESMADVFLLSFLPWEMKWLAKASMFRIPVVGWSLWLAGDVPVRRGESGSARGAMAKCREWIERGVPVMIFPEGTRSPTGELGAFKDGAFRLAIETRATVLPVAVAGTRTALPKHSWRFRRSHALATVGEPIATDGMTLDDVEALKAEARRRIEALRASLAPLVEK